jgi:L-fuculokinase
MDKTEGFPHTNRQHMAVFDIGKTNKKLLIFDHRLDLVDSAYETFEEFHQDGYIYEPMDEALGWFFARLREMTAKYDIGAVSVTAHGATFACLDNQGEPVLPVFSYTTDPGPEFHEKFNRRFGDVPTMQKKTTTPDMPGLGSLGKGIFFLQQTFPDAFEKTKTILNLPQYVGFRLTGGKAVEKTFIGAHTHLWDFDKGGWSEVFDGLGCRQRFPTRLSDPWDVMGTVSRQASEQTGLAESTLVTVGIHDSNASLLPYLVKSHEDFVLNSTGSVTVAMHPQNEAELVEEELGKVVYFNISAFSDPVKTSIFLGGLEFDIYMGTLAGIHGQTDYPDFDPDLLRALVRDSSTFVLPSIIPFGIFPTSEARILEDGKTFTFADISTGSHPALFSDFDRSYTAVSLSLAIQSLEALTIVGCRPGTDIYIEGGFAQNPFYTALIAAMFPESRVALTNLNEATAFGGALLAKAALEKTTPRALAPCFTIETRQVVPADGAGLDTYVERFLHHVQNG